MKWLRREPAGPAEIFGRSAERDQTSAGGVEAWADPVQPDGSLLAVTELLLPPGAARRWEPAPATDVLTWVVEGELVHEHGHAFCSALAGSLLHASADGAGHADRNDGTGPLRLVQVTVRRPAPPRTAVGPVRAPVLVAGSGVFEVLTHRTEIEVRSAHLHTVAGAFSVAGTPLRPGDSVRLFGTRTLEGAGTVLAWVPAGTAPAPVDPAASSG